MSIPPSVKTCLEDLDHKKYTLTKAILRVMVDWKDLDQHLDSTKTSLHDCVSNIESERGDLESARETLRLRLEEIESREECFRVYEKEEIERFRLQAEEIKSQEESFCVFQKEQVEMIERNREEMVALGATIRERSLEVERREVRVVSLSEGIEKDKMEFLEIKKSVEEKLGEIQSREREIAARTRLLDRKAKELDLKDDKLVASEKLTEESMGKLELERSDLDSREESFRLFQKEKVETFERREKELVELQTMIDYRMSKIHIKEVSVSLLSQGIEKEKLENEEIQRLARERLREIESRETEIQNRTRELDLEAEKLAAAEKSTEERANELELKRSDLESREESFCLFQKEKVETFEMKEKELVELQTMIDDRMSEVKMKEASVGLLSEGIEKEKLENEEIQRLARERLREIESRETEIQNRTRKLDLQVEILAAAEKLTEERANELESERSDLLSRKESFCLFQKEKLETFERKERELVELQTTIKGRMSEVKMKEVSVGLLLEGIKKEKLENEEIQRLARGRLREIESRETEIQNRTRELDLEAEKLAAAEKLAEERANELESERSDLESREESFGLYQKELVETFERKEKELGAMLTKIEDRRLGVEMTEGRVEREKVEFEEIQKSVRERLREIESGERKIGSRTRILDTRAKKLDLKAEKLAKIKKLAEERMNELHLKDEKLILFKQNMMKRFEEEFKEIRAKEKQFEQLFKEFELKAKQLEDCHKDFKLKEAPSKVRFHGFEPRKKQREMKGNKEQCKDQTSKDSGLKNDRLVKLLEASSQRGRKSKRSNNFGLKKKQIDVVQLEKDVPNLLTMDGKSLQIYLNENLKNSELLSSEVRKILGGVPDPAKLVLDAMVGFYPPHLKVGDNEFETAVVRKSCNLLLGNLLSLSPPIEDHVGEEASRLAGEWKEKMEAFPKDPLALLAFVQLSASFKLVLELNAKEILGVMELVPLHITVPELCRLLGLKQNVSGITKKLIENDQHLVAIRHILSCGLKNEFQPVPLLKNYIKTSKNSSRVRGHLEDNSCELQDWVIDDVITRFRAVISFVVDYKVECENCCNTLEEGIRQLQESKSGKGTKPFDFNSFWSSITSTFHPESAESRSNTTNPPVLPSVLRNMDGKNLLLFLSNHESMIKEVSIGLHMSRDPGKIVLDAARWLYPLASKKVLDDRDRLVRSCNFLLDALVKLSPVINSEVEKEARKLADDWIAKKLVDGPETNMGNLNNHNVLRINFSLFMAAYGLNKTSIHHRQGPEIRSSRSFIEKAPASNSLNKSEKINQPARKDEQVCESFSSSWDPIQCASDPFALILDAIKGCYYTNLGNTTSKILQNMRCFTTLLSQLLAAPLVVTTEVMELAKCFIAGWKLQMNREDPLQVWWFLLFLASYELASSCSEEELLGFLEIVYYRKEAADVLRSLGLESEVPNFIRRLVKKGFHLGALEYVYAFNLVSSFPPINFLKGYICYAKEEAEKLRKKGNYSLHAEEVVAEINGKALKEVKNFISLQNLGLGNTLGNVKPPNEARVALTFNASNCQLIREINNPATDVVHTEPEVLAPDASHEKKRKRLSTDHHSHNQVQSRIGEPSKRCKSARKIDSEQLQTAFQSRRSQRQLSLQQPL